MDPYIRTALDRAALVREIYRRVANVQHPDTWHPLERHLPELRQGRHDDRDRVGRRAGLLRVPAGPRRRGPRAAAISGWVSPFGGAAKLPWNLEWAAQWSLFGVTIEPCGKDLVDGRWLARPLRCDRPRGVRARAAAQRPVRVPQHRRQEDVDLQGPRRRRAHDRRGRAARAAALPVPAPPAEPRHRLRPGGHRPDPAPVRRVRQVRRGDRRPRGHAASCRRATRRRSATRCWIRRPTSPPRRPRSGRRSATSRCSSRSRASTSSSGSTAEKGSALTDARARDPRRARRSPPAPGSRPTRPDGAADRVQHDAVPAAAAELDDDAAHVPRGPRRARPSAKRPTERRRVAGADLRGRDGGRACPAGARSRRSIARSSAERTGRAPAGCWPASIRSSSRSAASWAEAGRRQARSGRRRR